MSSRQSIFDLFANNKSIYDVKRPSIEIKKIGDESYYESLKRHMFGEGPTPLYQHDACTSFEQNLLREYYRNEQLYRIPFNKRQGN